MPATRARFGDFEANLATGELSRRGIPVRLQDLPFRLLAALIEARGDLVRRADLAARLWDDGTFVDVEAGLNTAVAKLRDALGDPAEAPRYVETVPRRGYRLIAPVHVVDDGAPAAGLAAATAAAPDAGSPAALSHRGWHDARHSVGRAALVAMPFVLIVIGLIGMTITQGRAARAGVRVAVALFDNETGDAGFDRLAQVLTDSTVVRLTGNARLAVIGNAAVLRTSRPFRDLALIRDTVDADLIVIGQVQRVDADVRVLTHLIRASDEAHVWVRPTPLTDAGEAVLASAITSAIDEAVRAEIASPASRQARPGTVSPR